MTPAIIPPFLLARIAEAGESRFPRAAVAAARTLESVRARARSGSRLRLSIDEDGALVAETGPAPEREVADAQNREELPGVVVRRENDPATGDASADEAYDGLGATFDFLWDAFARNGIDGAGGALRATVHYGVEYDNAFWNGERMVFGDGDGEVFRGFTRSLSVIAHELTHGVTDSVGGLEYSGQSGALNESVSDVFGVLAEQHAADQTVEEATWLVGAGIFTAAVQGRALRSVSEPGTAYDDDVLGKDPQPAHMRDYVDTVEDNGGVHINSGIPNRAFYLTAAQLGGRAWERAGIVWYRTITSGLDPRIDFAGFAHATLDAARAEYGGSSEEVAAVRAGWNGVGLEADG